MGPPTSVIYLFPINLMTVCNINSFVNRREELSGLSCRLLTLTIFLTCSEDEFIILTIKILTMREGRMTMLGTK